MSEEKNELKDQINRMEIALLGYDGHLGLCAEFDKLAKDYYGFKKNCLIVFGILIGSGVLGITLVERLIYH